MTERWYNKKKPDLDDETELEIIDLDFLQGISTWKSLKKAYKLTGTLYASGGLKSHQLKDILSLLDSYSKVIDRKEIKSLQNNYEELLAEFEKLEEAIRKGTN